jgi:hypothetical protein
LCDGGGIENAESANPTFHSCEDWVMMSDENKQCNVDKPACIGSTVPYQWSQWGLCTKECGGGVKTRKCKQIAGNLRVPGKCPGESTSVCNSETCEEYFMNNFEPEFSGVECNGGNLEHPDDATLEECAEWTLHNDDCSEHFSWGMSDGGQEHCMCQSMHEDNVFCNKRVKSDFMSVYLVLKEDKQT